MTLRRKFALYLVLLHLILASALLVLLWDYRVWLLGVELFLAVSSVIAMKLFRGFFQPLESLLAGAEWLQERDFSTRLRASGQNEMDVLIGVYNKMIDSLREERITLQEQQYLLAKLIDASPAGIIILDFEDRITQVNPVAERMLRLTAPSLASLGLAEIPSRLAGGLAELRLDEPRVLSVTGIRRIKCTRSQFVDRGSPRGFIVLEELTEELLQSEKAAYEKLIRMMSHEVNNSLGAANSLLHSLLKYKEQLQVEDREDFVSALAVIISRAEHLNSFTKNFADIVRLPKPARQPVDLNGLLEQICTLMKVDCDSRGISLVKKFDRTVPLTVTVDRQQMEQVFVNIVKNAIEAIGSGGTITVASARKDGRTAVTIEDNGAGIPPHLQGQIFTPFFSTKENGQGIGLTLVQEILTQHGVEFSLESDPAGTTRFVIYFP